jgi:hypothetical protein
MSTWELQRQWEIVRYLVYYLVEDFVPSELISGKDIIDFSAGLGDLSLYMAEHNPRSLTATSPDDFPPPTRIASHPEIKYRPAVPARSISMCFPEESCDLFVARMVFQFPTQEGHYVDVDGMLSQIYSILRPGGQLLICSHQYTELDPQLESRWPEPMESYFERLLQHHQGDKGAYLAGLVELIQTIGIPPREGSHGQTGFGLKPSMAVDSFVRAGFLIESAAELEEFTFPIGVSREILERPEYYAELAQEVFAIKAKHIQRPRFAEKYQRPEVLGEILNEINQFHPFVTIPIFSLLASKPPS